jgi:hypothetical protein
MGAEVTFYQHGQCQERRHGYGARAGNFGSAIQVMLSPERLGQTPWLFNTLRSSACLPALLGSHYPIAGIKRARCVKDTLRNTLPDCSDSFMEAATGLHNLRVRYRKRRLKR